MKNKILYITTSYILKNSSAAIRNNSLVKGLIELGYTVDVYTVRWPNELYSPFFLAEKNGNIHFSDLSYLKRISDFKKAIVSGNNSKIFLNLKILIKKLVFFPDECYEWEKEFGYNHVDQYDYIITSSDHKTSHFVGLRMKKKYPDLPWVQIWGDPWCLDINSLKFMKCIIAYSEKKLLKFADNLVYVSSVTCMEMGKKYPLLKNKMHYIPRGYYFEILGSNAEKSDEIIRIVYTGAISWGRNIFQLLNVLEKQDSKSKWLVEVYGNYSQDIQEKLLSYSFVRVHEGVDFEYMPEIYSSASILLYLSNKKGSTQIPGKFFDYMGTSKPILCLVDDVNDNISFFLKSFDRCIVIENAEYCITDQLPILESCKHKSFMPEESFSPKAVARKIASLL